MNRNIVKIIAVFVAVAIILVIEWFLVIPGMLPVQGTTLPIAASSASNAEKLDLNNETMLMITNLRTDICSISDYRPYFYNFNDKLTTGISEYGFPVPVETDLYGIKAEVTGNNTIKFILYNNTDKNIDLIESYIENCTSSDKSLFFRNELDIDKVLEIDASLLPYFNVIPRLYRLTANISADGKMINVYSYFFTNINEVKLCAVSNEKYTYREFLTVQKHRFVISNRIVSEKIVPEEQTCAVGTIYYPHWDFNDPDNYRCDTELWAETAAEIADDNMSDELKVWMFYNWLTKNIAYDEYKRDNIKNEFDQCYSRAYSEGDYSGKQSVYDLRCGVCTDYANIFAIFCRTYSIPTIVLSNTTHAWNAVYLNGRWIEIDCSVPASYYVQDKDASVRISHDEDYIRRTHKFDLDATKAGDYENYQWTMNKINTYLYTDKLRVR